MKRLIVVFALLSSAATASAGPVLLASFGGSVGSGSTGLTDPRVRVGLLVTASSDTGTSISTNDILFSTNFLHGGESGEYWFNAETNPQVTEFNNLLTNGNDDRINLFTGWPELERAGIRGDRESFYFERDVKIGESPDLVGFQLVSIRLVISDLRIEPLVVRDQEELIARFSYGYEFYGTPIPEPGTCVLVAIGSLALWKKSSLCSLPIRTEGPDMEVQS